MRGGDRLNRHNHCFVQDRVDLILVAMPVVAFGIAAPAVAKNDADVIPVAADAFQSAPDPATPIDSVIDACVDKRDDRRVAIVLLVAFRHELTKRAKEFGVYGSIK